MATRRSARALALTEAGETLAAVRRELVGARDTIARLQKALAEAAQLLERCTPPRFRDRELAPTIADYRALAGLRATRRAADCADDRPTLGAPPPRGDEDEDEAP
jgi:DNA-binding transcriptional LysR family regulator